MIAERPARGDCAPSRGGTRGTRGAPPGSGRASPRRTQRGRRPTEDHELERLELHDAKSASRQGFGQTARIVATRARRRARRHTRRRTEWTGSSRLVSIPVTDVDRAKAFYVDQAGFTDDHDHTVSDQLRFVQLAAWLVVLDRLGTGLTSPSPARRRCSSSSPTCTRPAGGCRPGARRERGAGLRLGVVRVLPPAKPSATPASSASSATSTSPAVELPATDAGFNARLQRSVRRPSVTPPNVNLRRRPERFCHATLPAVPIGLVTITFGLYPIAICTSCSARWIKTVPSSGRSTRSKKPSLHGPRPLPANSNAPARTFPRLTASYAWRLAAIHYQPERLRHNTTSRPRSPTSWSPRGSSTAPARSRWAPPTCSARTRQGRWALYPNGEEVVVVRPAAPWSDQRSRSQVSWTVWVAVG